MLAAAGETAWDECLCARGAALGHAHGVGAVQHAVPPPPPRCNLWQCFWDFQPLKVLQGSAGHVLGNPDLIKCAFPGDIS